MVTDSWKFLMKCSKTDVQIYYKGELPKNKKELMALSYEEKQKIVGAAMQLDVAYSTM